MGRARRLLLWICFALATLPAARLQAQSARQWTQLREQMVETDIVGAGLKHKGVIAVMRTTPRHEFLPDDQRRLAYYDMALPIGEHQTISPPFVVASMTAHLDPRPEDKVLEIGTGSGYQAAVLAGLVREVYTIEIVEPLGRRAAETLERLGYKNVHPKIGDGFQGWPEHAPFDKIIVTCSPENVPRALVEQLKEGGRVIVPLGERYQQTLYLLKKVDGKLVSQALEPTFFVPMTGQAEDIRSVKPAGPHTAIVNGGFELDTKFSGVPDGWYYVRQAKLQKQDLSGHGQRMLQFKNSEPGYNAQALQAIGVDGREVRSLDVSAWLRGKGLSKGRVVGEQAKVLITFFDEDRGPVGQEMLGPWNGTFAWTHETARLHVPEKARLAVVALGLMGGTGELACDDFSLEGSAE